MQRIVELLDLVSSHDPEPTTRPPEHLRPALLVVNQIGKTGCFSSSRAVSDASVPLRFRSSSRSSSSRSSPTESPPTVTASRLGRTKNAAHAPALGASKPHQVDEAAAAIRVTPTTDETQRLSDLSVALRRTALSSLR